MSSLAAVLKGLVPRSLKSAIKERLRRSRFRQAFAAYRALPPDREPPHDVVAELVAAWGNESFSSLGEYIFAIVRHARLGGGSILECGSGLSTLLLGLEAGRKGRRVWTLEHHPEWAGRMERELRDETIDAVTLCRAPLRTFGAYAWYDAPNDRMPRDFSLVICDGPPGDTPGGRYGMLPQVRDLLAPGCVILLDDYERPDEQTAAAKWVAETGATLERFGAEKPYALLRLP